MIIYKTCDEKELLCISTNFLTLLLQVLKRVHPDKTISAHAMQVVDDLTKDILQKIAAEAKNLAKYRKRKTLTRADIKTSIMLLFPKEIAEFANQHGNEV